MVLIALENEPLAYPCLMVERERNCFCAGGKRDLIRVPILETVVLFRRRVSDDEFSKTRLGPETSPEYINQYSRRFQSLKLDFGYRGSFWQDF